MGNMSKAAKRAADKLAAAEAAKAKAAEQEQRNAAKQRRDDAANAAKRNSDYREAKKARVASYQEEFAGILFHNVEVTGGRKIPHGTKAECVLVTATKWLTPLAMILIKGEKVWIDPKHLTAKSPLSAARKAALQSEVEEERNATVMVNASATEVGESVVLNYSGWFSRIRFAKSMVTKLGEFDERTDIFEVPLWKVKQAVGQDSVDALLAKQDMYANHLKMEG